MARWIARPVEYVMTLPPLNGERGAEAVSAATTETASAAMPRPSGGDHREAAHAARDIDDAGHDRHPPVGLEPADGRRGLASRRATRRPPARPPRRPGSDARSR